MLAIRCNYHSDPFRSSRPVLELPPIGPRNRSFLTLVILSPPSPITRVTEIFGRSSHRFFLATRCILHSCVALSALSAVRGRFSVRQCCSLSRRHSPALPFKLTRPVTCTAAPPRPAATAGATRDVPTPAAPGSAIPQDAPRAGVPTPAPSPGCAILPTVPEPARVSPTRRAPNAPATNSLFVFFADFLNGLRWPPSMMLRLAALFPAPDFFSPIASPETPESQK